MRYPQVTDRMKEAPIKALRAIFAGFGQVLLVADRARSRALEQDTAQDAEHQPPADQPVPAAAAQRPESKQPESKQPESKQPESKWRSLDETGNVRLLSDPDLADAGLAAAETTGSAGAAGSVAEAAPAEPDAAPAETDAAPPEADDALAETAAAAPETAAAAPEPDAEVSDSGIAAPEPHVVIAEAAAAAVGPGQELAGAFGAPAGPDTSGAAASPAGAPAAAASPASLPLRNYDELTFASLRARLRNLDTSQLRVLVEYERAHEARDAVLTMFERRIAKLSSGQD